MSAIRYILVLGLSIIFYAAPMSAQMKIVPKHKLDSLANPPLVAGVERIVRFDAVDIGEFTINEADGIAEFEYDFENISSKDFLVTQIKTTCACVKAKSSPMLVEAGGKAKIKVQYNPKGHPGKFARRLFVFSSLDEKRPIAVLILRVNVR